MFRVKNLKVEVEGKKILGGVNFAMDAGEVVVLMGPNGSGKSSLALTLAGHPSYLVVGGAVEWDGENWLDLEPVARAKKGMILAFQSPVAIPGVSVFHFLREAYQLRSGAKENVVDFRRRMEKMMDNIGLDKDFLKRSVNDGFSGGERKKMELLQIMLFEPKIVILDEIDSGMDVDSLRHVSKVVGEVKKRGASVLIITHYARVVGHVKPDKVLVIKGGKIVREGGVEVVSEIEESGYLGVDSEDK